MKILGIEVTVRKPTEAEAIALEEARAKFRRLASKPEDDGPVDYTDDGDNEVLACVTSPGKAEMLALLEDAPLSILDIEGEVRRLGGDEDPARVRRLVYLVDGVEVKLTPLGRDEIKMLSRQYARRGGVPQARLSKLAKEHIDGAQPDWEAHPFLSMALAGALYEAARGREEAAAGK